jgi:hypothetical protein
MIEPTPEEKKNGWTAQTLTAYLAERQKQEDEVFHSKKPKRQKRTIYKSPRHG